MNNCSILSMHTDRKIIVPLGKHSFTLYFSQIDRQTELWKEEIINPGWAG